MLWGSFEYLYDGALVDSTANIVDLDARWMYLTLDTFMTQDPLSFGGGSMNLTEVRGQFVPECDRPKWDGPVDS